MIHVSEILEYIKNEGIDYEYEGDYNLTIFSYCPLRELKNNSITWIRNMKEEYNEAMKLYTNLLVVSNAKSNGNCICVNNPHKVYFKIIERFFVSEKQVYKISARAVVETKNIGKNISIGNFSYIGPDVILGNNIRIDHNVTIEGRVIIGDDTIVESGTVIGLCGFGHYKNDDGTSERIPHLGGVNIGKNCYIGANCTIARGTLSDTIIGDFVKIDALCHIAHNDIIGNRVMITGGAKIAGSTIVKDDVWIGPNATINNSLVIGEQSFIGLGSVVTKNVPSGKAVFGFPARVMKDNQSNVYNS